MPLKDFPDHHDADLVLKLYDLRRESVMRESRTRLLSTFLPTSFADVLAITSPNTRSTRRFASARPSGK